MFWPSVELFSKQVLFHSNFFFLRIKKDSLFRGSALLARACERTCVTADSVPIWGSDFAFSSILKTCWW